MLEELKQIGAQIGNAQSTEELQAVFLAFASYMGKTMPCTTAEELKQACKPFTETEAYQGMERLVYCNEHFDELGEENQIGNSRNENERELWYEIEAYNALDGIDLKLLWLLKACFGGKRDGEIFLLRYLRKQYFEVCGVDMRYVVQGLETLINGKKEGATA